jgi:flagellar biosynthesis anti-sigma factor FlgM
MKAKPSNPAFPVDAPGEVRTAPARQRAATSRAQRSASVDCEQPTPEAKPVQRTRQRIVHTPQERDAKVQALQQAVEQGSYHVPAEELAAKMLQDTLQEQLP